MKCVHDHTKQMNERHQKQVDFIPKRVMDQAHDSLNHNICINWNLEKKIKFVYRLLRILGGYLNDLIYDSWNWSTDKLFECALSKICCFFIAYDVFGMLKYKVSKKYHANQLYVARARTVDSSVIDEWISPVLGRFSILAYLAMLLGLFQLEFF